MNAIASHGAAGVAPHYADQFDDLVLSVHASLEEASRRPLFRVATPVDLFDAYLSAFGAPDRQYHNCNCCRHFINRYGALATVEPNGALRSAVWDESRLPAGHPYAPAVRALREAVEAGRLIDRAAWAGGQPWGVPESGGFHHLFWVPSNSASGVSVVLTPDAAAAAWREDRRHLDRALRQEFSPDLPHLTAAVDLLRSGALSRPEKLLPMAEFLQRAQAATSAVAPRDVEGRSRALWLLVAEAAPGWCTPRSSALGALVSDLAEGMSPSVVARRHADRMDPTQYQRPTKAPAAGNVARAEARVQALGLAPALLRRHARADEVVLEWSPAPTHAAADGVFSHLLKPQQPSGGRAHGRSIPMTWARFRREVLPGARRLLAVVPGTGNFMALTTAVHPDAPPILQWDSPECRNPFAWYVYTNGSRAQNWNLVPGQAVEVVGVTMQPSMWGRSLEDPGHHGASVLFMLRGARDSGAPGSALFPELLRSDLHEVRATLEAHSRRVPLERLPDEAQCAAGLRLESRVGSTPVELEVHPAAGPAQRYLLDRLD